MATATKSRSRSKSRGQKTPRGESAGPRSMWSGSISFGLVNIPVRLLAAVREQRVAFHLLHDQDKARPRGKLVCAGAGKSYRLLVEAMNRTKKVGIAKFVFHDKEYLAAIRPVGVGLCLETMHF